MSLFKRYLNLRAACWSVVATASISSAIGIALLAGQMAPISRGTSHMFWNVATGAVLSPEGDFDWGGDAFFMDDQWAVFDVYHMHGSRTYYVPAPEVTADFNSVVAALEPSAQQGKPGGYIKGYLKWRDDPKQERTAKSLVTVVRQELRRLRIERALERGRVGAIGLFAVDEQLIWQRWRRMDWYWATLAFEWAFLTGIVIFAVWPGIRGQSAVRWAMHMSLLPLLFLLPAYLGYSTSSFTSAGPTGGIVYPFLLYFWIHGWSTDFDEFVLAHVPPILETLSAPIGTPMALTGMGMPGPTNALCDGILGGGAILVVHRGFHWWIKRHARSVSSEDD